MKDERERGGKIIFNFSDRADGAIIETQNWGEEITDLTKGEIKFNETSLSRTKKYD